MVPLFDVEIPNFNMFNLTLLLTKYSKQMLDIIIIIESSRGSLVQPEFGRPGTALDYTYSSGQELVFEHTSMRGGGGIAPCAVEGTEFPQGLSATLA